LTFIQSVPHSLTMTAPAASARIVAHPCPLGSNDAPRLRFRISESYQGALPSVFFRIFSKRVAFLSFSRISSAKACGQVAQFLMRLFDVSVRKGRRWTFDPEPPPFSFHFASPPWSFVPFMSALLLYDVLSMSPFSHLCIRIYLLPFRPCFFIPVVIPSSPHMYFGHLSKLITHADLFSPAPFLTYSCDHC